MADEVRVRPFFFSSVLHLAFAAAWSLARALGAPEPVALYGLWILLAGFVALLLEGLTYWYFKSFTKRRILVPAAAWGVLGLHHAAVFGTLAHLVVDVPAHLLPGVPFALAVIGFAAQVLASAYAGPTWRSGGPMFARSGPHARGDAFAAAAGAVGLGGFTLAGLLAVAGVRNAPVAALVALLLVGFLPFLAGWSAFLLPRNGKRPLPAPRAAWAALMLGALGGLGVVAAFVAPFRYGSLLQPAGVLALLGAAGLAALWLFLPYATPKPGALLARARPYFVAAGALALAAGFAVASGASGYPPGAVAALPLLALAVSGGAAGVSLLGLPVLANQRPGPRSWGVAAALALGVTGVTVALYATTGAGSGPGAVFGAAAAGLYGKQLSPLRKPRRACPP